jgi:hypothetical protein
MYVLRPSKMCVALLLMLMIALSIPFVTAHGNVPAEPSITSTKTSRLVKPPRSVHPSARKLFDVANGNMQGLANHNGAIFVGFDEGGGKGEIRVYSASGKLIKDSGPLPIGHTASLTYRTKNGHIYVTNGGGTNPTKIYEVDVSAAHPKVLRTIDFGRLGNSGLMAFDNARDKMWLETAANDYAPVITFSYCDVNGHIFRQFTIKNQGVPQGLDVYQNRIYYYTNDKITVLDYSGHIIKSLALHLSGESEGLTIVTGKTPYIIFGYNKPNRLYVLKGFM